MSIERMRGSGLASVLLRLILSLRSASFPPVFTLSTYKAEDLGCLFRAGRPPGAVDPGGGGGAPTPLRPPCRPVLWPPTGLRPGLVHSITSSHDTACGQAGAFGPIADRPFNALNVRDDGDGEDSTGSRITGSYNNWHRESGFAGGGEGVRSGLLGCRALNQQLVLTKQIPKFSFP